MFNRPLTSHLVGITFFFVLLTSTHSFAAKPLVVTVKDGTTTFYGDLYLPKKAKNNLPLVVVIHEWWGKTDYPQMRAKKIADEFGYAALAVDLYGEAKSVSTPSQAQALATPFYQNPLVSVKRLQEFIATTPIAAAKEGATIDVSKVAAIGYCFGGSQALNLARSGKLAGGAKLVAVAAFHAGLASSLKSDGKIDAKILVLHGLADPMVKAEEVAAFKDEMTKTQASLTFVTYEKATHAFTNPKATKIGRQFNIPIAYNKKADKNSWLELKKFLSQAL
jgi:dienelactone hydrolase